MFVFDPHETDAPQEEDGEGGYILDDEDDCGGEGGEGLEHGDPFGLLSADPNPPPTEEAWALAAAELSAEAAGLDGESMGAVDLDLLEVPPGSPPLVNDDRDDGEEPDLMSLDVADFLPLEVGVGAAAVVAGGEAVAPGVSGYADDGARGDPAERPSASVVAERRPGRGGDGDFVGQDGGRGGGAAAAGEAHGGGSGRGGGGDGGKPTREEEPAGKPTRKGGSGREAGRRGNGGAGAGVGGLDGLTADEVPKGLLKRCWIIHLCCVVSAGVRSFWSAPHAAALFWRLGKRAATVWFLTGWLMLQPFFILERRVSQPHGCSS